MAQLRQKIEPVPEHPRFILTIPGVGYRFNDEFEGQQEKQEILQGEPV